MQRAELSCTLDDGTGITGLYPLDTKTKNIRPLLRTTALVDIVFHDGPGQSGPGWGYSAMEEKHPCAGAYPSNTHASTQADSMSKPMMSLPQVLRSSKPACGQQVSIVVPGLAHYS